MNSMNKTYTQNSPPKSSSGFGTMPSGSKTSSATPRNVPGAASTSGACSRMANARASSPWPAASPGRRTPRRPGPRTSPATIRQSEPLGRAEGPPSLSLADGRDPSPAPRGSSSSTTPASPSRASTPSASSINTAANWARRPMTGGRRQRRPRLAPGQPRPVSLKSLAEILPRRKVTCARGPRGNCRPSSPGSGSGLGRVGPRGCAGAEPIWLMIEERSDGQIQYAFSNLPPRTSRIRAVRLWKSRWPVEQGYQQMKEELRL